jgi:hypothetical protein
VRSYGHKNSHIINCAPLLSAIAGWATVRWVSRNVPKLHDIFYAPLLRALRVSSIRLSNLLIAGSRSTLSYG